jgi:hypothetical protein
VDRANTQHVYVTPPRRTETVVIPSPATVADKLKEKISGQEEEIVLESEPERTTSVPVRVPFPSRMEKPKEDKQFAKFLDAMKDVQITIPILDAVMHVPLYAKFFKELITKKRSLDSTEVITLTKDCSAVIKNQMPLKLEDLGSFCVPCMIGKKKFKALCDLGSSVSVIPYSVCKDMQLGTVDKTNMTLQLADRTSREPNGIISDVPVTVEKFSYPVDFVVLEMDDNSDSIILGRPFLATAGALIDVQGANLTLRLGSEHITFNMNNTIGLPELNQRHKSISSIAHCVKEVYAPDILPLTSVAEIKNQQSETDQCHFAVYQIADDKERTVGARNKDEVELKPLPVHLKYAYLGSGK